MKFFFSALLISQIALAVTPADYNACVQSYLPHSTVRFNVTSSGPSPDNRLLFASSWLDAPAINIYHKGAFWIASVESLSSTSDKKKVARIKLGADIFCLEFDLNRVFTDKFKLSPNNRSCASAPVVNFEKSELPNNQRLASRIANDVDLGQFCFADLVSENNFNCTSERKAEDFRKIRRWNTAACKKLNVPAIDKMIARHEKILRDYPRIRDGVSSPASPAPAASGVQRTN